MSGFFWVVVSALFHAGWNILLKKSKTKFRFNLDMHAASVVIFTAVIIGLYEPLVAQGTAQVWYKIVFDRTTILYGMYAAIFFAVYHLLVAKAYSLADVSQVYPITTSSPLFVTIWAALLLHEKVSLLGIAGILVTIFGCLVMNGASLHRTKLQAGVIAALFAAFAYSFGALFDKIAVNNVNAVMYTYYMNLFMMVFFAITFYMKRNPEIKIKNDRKWVWIAGIVIVLSSITYRWGIMDIPISYAVAIRQVSGLFGVIMGVIFFREGYGRMRFIGSLIIIAGIVLLRLEI